MKKLRIASKPVRRKRVSQSPARSDDDLRRAQLRLAELFAQYKSDQTDQPALADALAELQNSIEELFVVQAERNDQTRQLQATLQELESERSRYRSLFHLMPYPYFVTDSIGR